MATVAWVVMKHHKKEDGTYNPKVRISHNRTSSYVATAIYTEMVRFRKGSSSGIVTSESIKEELDMIVSEYRNVINSNPSAVQNCATSKDVLELIKRRNESRNLDFIKYAREVISAIRNEGTRGVKTACINSLCQFLEHKGMERLSISQLTSSLLRGYEAWLRTDRVLRVRTSSNAKKEYRELKAKAQTDTGVNLYMTIIKSIFNKALLEFNDYETGDIVITNNPFRAYTMPQPVIPKKRAVDVDTIRKIYGYQSNKKHIQLVRDIYIISFMLAGMNIADMFDFQINGNHIEYERKKTRGVRKDNAFISVYIHPLAMDIIRKYDDGTGNTVFDELANRYGKAEYVTKVVSVGLKKICSDLEIDGIQFYSARHSFATIARNDCGFGKDDIGVCLNHSSGRTVTDSYIKEDFSIIEKVIRKVIEFVFLEKK